MSRILIEWVKVGSSTVAIITAALSLVGWINQSYLGYLTQHFATKTDMARMEAKLDKLIEVQENSYGKIRRTFHPVQDPDATAR